MFGPFRTAGKVDPEPMATYPRLVIERDDNRLVETKKGEFLIEERISTKDSLGAPRQFWTEVASFKTHDKGYQSPIPPRTVIWLVQVLEEKL